MKRLLICLAIVCILFPALSFAGIEWTTSIKATGKGKKQNNEIDTHTYAQGGNVKQVFEGVSNENMLHFQDGYWLYKSDDDNIYVVDDKEKKVTIISINDLLQVTGALGQIAEIEILDHSIKVEQLEPEKILNYHCNHIKVTTEYTMKIKISFIKKAMKVVEVREIWSTTDIPEYEELSASFQSKNYRTGIPELDEMIRKDIEHNAKIGFQLKAISHTTQMNKKGKQTGETAITTMTVTRVKKKEFPSNFFEIPGNYDRLKGPGEASLGVF